MTKFLCFIFGVCLLVSLTSIPSLASVGDFVAVADNSGGAIGNPAGLADLDDRTLTWDHRFTDRDEQNIGWDDLVVYNAPGRPGNGAIFYGYSQYLLAANFYGRVVSYGYSYGWRTSELVNAGVTIKNSTVSSYDNSTGTMIQQSSVSNIMFDFGLQMKFAPRWQLGLAVHNIGRDMAVERFYYDTVLGVGYQDEKLTFGAEIFDYLNEGGNPNYRLGCRYELIPGLRPWVVLLITDNGNMGENFGLEYRLGDRLNFEASWMIMNTNTQNVNAVKATIGYRF